MRNVKIIVEKHDDGYVAYPLGLKGVVVGEGNSYEEALADVRSATGAVRLHAALREMPRWVLTAVLAHELAHAFHPDHSDAFWSLLRRVCPDADRSRAFLTGVSWLARRWDEIPPVERALLAGSDAGKSQDSGNS